MSQVLKDAKRGETVYWPLTTWEDEDLYRKPPQEVLGHAVWEQILEARSRGVIVVLRRPSQ